MIFKEVLSNKISEKLPYKKYVKCVGVFDTKDSLLPNNYFVDIRVKYDNSGVENATRQGVFISMQEFAEILPFMVKGEEHRIIGEGRMLWFRASKHQFIYELLQRKSNGKETVISLTLKEIKHIYMISDILNSFSL